MSHVIKTYDEDMKQAIFYQYNKARIATEEAKQKMRDALVKHRSAGALVDKCKQSHPQDIRHFLSDGMSPSEIDGSLRCHKLGMIRPDHMDNAQLRSAGMLTLQDAYTKPASKPKPTMFRAITKAVNLVKTAAKDHDCGHWSEEEREVTKRALEPLVELYRELNS